MLVIVPIIKVPNFLVIKAPNIPGVSMKRNYSSALIDRLLETRIIKGFYPDVVIDYDEADDILLDITRSYLYRDILQFQSIKNPEILSKLLQALALQIGNEVSYNELANELQIDKNTIANYINILEKAFIIFRLNPYSKNLRNELKKLRKIYFVDTGIRNALINNLNSLINRAFLESGNSGISFLIFEIKLSETEIGGKSGSGKYL